MLIKLEIPFGRQKKKRKTVYNNQTKKTHSIHLYLIFNKLIATCRENLTINRLTTIDRTNYSGGARTILKNASLDRALDRGNPAITSYIFFSFGK